MPSNERYQIVLKLRNFKMENNLELKLARLVMNTIFNRFNQKSKKPQITKTTVISLRMKVHTMEAITAQMIMTMRTILPVKMTPVPIITKIKREELIM